MNPSPGSRVLDLVERSVIVQATVTLGLVAAVIYMAVLQLPIPDLLAQLTLLALGFYFGSKVGNSMARTYFAKEH